MQRVVARRKDPTRPMTQCRKPSVYLEAMWTMDSEVSGLEAEQHRKMQDYCYTNTELDEISYQQPCAYW
jgi:hypothetical protein